MPSVSDIKSRRYRLTEPGEQPEIVLTFTGGTFSELEESLMAKGAADGLAATAAEIEGPRWAESRAHWAPELH